MNRPLVSVIVPTYNRAYCLARAIDSALAQTYQPVEVIVLDDGSTDGGATEELVRSRYGCGEARVRYERHAQNQGVSAARNSALDLARGDHIAFLDSDDCWKPWKLEVQLNCLQRAPEIGMIWSDMEAVNPQGEVFDPAFLRTVYAAYAWFSNDALFPVSVPLGEIVPHLAEVVADRRFYVGDIFSQMIMGNLVHTSTVVLTRERLSRVRLFRTDLQVAGEDYDFHLRTCREGPVGYVDLSSIRYQRGMPDRLSQDGLHLSLNFLKAMEPMIQHERDRINLPDRMVRAALAHGHRWAGEQLLDAGRRAEARRHLIRSLSQEPWHMRTLRLLVAATLPPGLSEPLRRSYRALKALAPDPTPLGAGSQLPSAARSSSAR